MIILKLWGGLGNQMFEYAFGRHIQEQLGDKLLLDISSYKYDIKRKYSLNHYNINGEIDIDDTGKYNYLYDQSKNIFLKIGSLISSEMLYELMSPFGIYIWLRSTYKKVEITKNRKNIYINGYWQSFHYFDDILNEIKKEFMLKVPLDSKYKALAQQIRNANSVCVHIRRGDFLLATNSLHISALSYYDKAIHELKQKYENLDFYIFSDDIDDVRQNFKFTDKCIHLVERNNPDYIELYLMTQCKHFIISNSTFSWWAANLSEYSEKSVIAPKVWYRDHRDMSHLIRKEWTVIENE